MTETTTTRYIDSSLLFSPDLQEPVYSLNVCLHLQVDSGLIVVAYKDGSPAHTHFLKSEQVVQYWDKWLYRLEEYNGE